MHRLIIVPVLLMAVSAIGGCAPEALYDARYATDGVSEEVYTQTIQPLFDQYCIVCHGQDRQDFGINLSSYAAAMAGDKNGDPHIIPFDSQASSTYRTIKGGFMPIGIPPMQEDEIEKIRVWIDGGAPGPASQAVTDVVAASSFFTDQVKPIMVEYCVPCHGNARQDFGINLETYEGIMKGDQYGFPVVVPFNRLFSSVYRSVLTPYMPPGPDMITDSEADIIGQWIDMGLPAPTPFLIRSKLPVAANGVAYSFALEATSGIAPFRFALSAGSVLPTGLELLSSGYVTGTPTDAAAEDPYLFAVDISDSAGVSGRTIASIKVFSVLPPELTFADDILPMIETCSSCHRLEDERGGWKVDKDDVDESYAEMFEYGRVIRGDAQRSPFYKIIRDGSMARYFMGDLQVVKDWIDDYNAQK